MAAEKLRAQYVEAVGKLERILRVSDNFDVIKREGVCPGCDMTFFYIDGFVKDGEMQRIMQYLFEQKSMGTASEAVKIIPYVEVEVSSDTEKITTAVLAGQTAMLADTFGDEVVLLDLRTYPARQTAEPESDRVMQGSRDGFVETLVMNTALLRRRIRDPRLTMKHFDIGGSSHTDIVVCYMKEKADERDVLMLCEKIESAKPKTLTLGTQSLAETLIRRRWFNPFPKIRTTERPDTAAAQVLEGSIIVFCDTSPEVMILPSSIFDFIEEADDYCFPPLTGTYLRLVRVAILILSVISTPLWYLMLENAQWLPAWLAFVVPSSPGSLPIIAQLFIAELAIDGLKLASMNTPSMLSNSLSVVGGLILGDFAVEVGWFCGDVILYMACVTIANFAQQNHELGYAFKFMRMMILALVGLFGIYGFFIGIVLFCIFVASNATVFGRRRYLYPLIPFNKKAFLRHFIRVQKSDFEN